MSPMIFSSDPSKGCVPSFTVRAEQMTLPPSAANTLAISSPIPLLAPVTMTTFPSSLPMHASLQAYDTLAFVESTIKLDNDPVWVIHVEAANVTLRIRERLPWAAELRALGHQLLQQALSVWHCEREVRNTHLVQLQRCTGDLLARVTR